MYSLIIFYNYFFIISNNYIYINIYSRINFFFYQFKLKQDNNINY